jgi:hypothetical protein
LFKQSILEIDMDLFSRTVLYRPIATHKRLDSSEITFGAWASIILAGLAIVSVALGMAPVG